ncbi:copper resistance protein B [Luteimonas sp. MJ250]|uniref:copper resistance protein B n=1 Tax=Luteimonas sp. MJ250 TaxID=3129236 RepID=UPI0031BBAF3F
MSGMHATLLSLAIVLATAATGQAQAQDHATTGHSQMDHSTMDHSTMDHSTMDHSTMDHSTTDHSGHAGPSGSPAPVTPIPTLTDADRAAAFPKLERHMTHASAINSYLLFNRFEAWDADPGSGQAWEAQGWFGTDLHRLWLRTEGERSGGTTESADLELLYGRSVSAWWDVVAGVKRDFAPDDSQTWAAFGVQGLAPYMFEVSVTGYVGESGRTALVAEAEYELLLSNRLILQPVVEATLFGKDDPARGVGSGLSSMEAGLRLRYELNRHFAPYIGVVHERTFGGTSRLRRSDGGSSRDTRAVIGFRFWF